MALAASPRLIALLFTDLVDSSGLKVQLGDADYVAHVARPHNEILRETFAEHRGVVNNYTGDGFLATFGSVTDAVNAALLAQERLRRHAWKATTPQIRIGIHLGDSTLFVEEGDSRELLASHAADMCARLMSLAGGGQTLLTRAAFDSARQNIRRHPGPDESGGPLELVWLAHGHYLFKGQPEPIEVCEVGAKNLAPLTAPADAEKAKRAVTAEEQAMFGWRPAPELTVPRRTDWIIEEKLGQGGFGEVWLARHRRTKEQRVFKFCFDAARVRHFKRELTLFKLLREVLGERPDIAKLLEVQFDEPPYFLESEFVREGNLRQWADGVGGIAAVPMETRLALVAQIARAVAAAHSIGIIHKDLKPSNILVSKHDDGAPQPMLADFGIGAVIDYSLLQQHDITLMGLTRGTLDDSSDSGTRLYQPPELMAGRPLTVQGDVYALGVMLYQLAVGDMSRPLGSGWESDVTDPLLQQDIRDATHFDPKERLASAVELAERIETLDARRQSRIVAEKSVRRARRARILAWAVTAMALLTTLAGGLTMFSYNQWQDAEEARLRADRETTRAERNLGLAQQRRQEADNARLTERQAREAAEQQKLEAEKQRDRTLQLAQTIIRSLEQLNPRKYDVTVSELLDQMAEELPKTYDDNPVQLADILTTLGDVYRGNGFYKRSLDMYSQARDLYLKHLGANHPSTMRAINGVGNALTALGRPEEAIPLHQQAYEGRKKVLGEFAEDTLDSLHCQAFAMIEAGQLDAAIPLQKRLLAEMEEHLGKTHSYTLTAINNLGYAYEKANQLPEALQLFQQRVELSTARLGPNHPDTLDSLANVAWVDYRLGRYDEAISLHKKTLDVEIQILGKTHDSSLTHFNNSLHAMVAAQRFVDAAALCDAYLGEGDERQQMLGMLSVNSLLRVASIYFAARRPSEGAQVYREADPWTQKLAGGGEHASGRELYLAGIGYALVARAMASDDDPNTDPAESKRLALVCLRAAAEQGVDDFGSEGPDEQLSSLLDSAELEDLLAIVRKAHDGQPTSK